MPGDRSRATSRPRSSSTSGEREVDAGGDPGRRPDVAVADEDRLRVDGRPRDTGGRASRSAASGWWPGGRRGGRPRRAGTPRCTPTRPAAARRRVRRAASRRAAGRGRAGARRRRARSAVSARAAPVRSTSGQQAQAAGGAHRRAADAAGPDGVRPGLASVGPGEHLHGSGDVEALHPVEEDDEHRCAAMRPILAGRRGCQQRRVPHLSCHVRVVPCQWGARSVCGLAGGGRPARRLLCSTGAVVGSARRFGRRLL